MAQYTYVNKCAVPFALYNDKGEVVFTALPVAPAATVAELTTPAGTDGPFPLVNKNYGEVKNLPAPTPGVRFIVTKMVLDAVGAARSDLVAPDSGTGAVRNEKGQIIGTRALVVYSALI
jgi:hypothetical protein